MAVLFTCRRCTRYLLLVSALLAGCAAPAANSPPTTAPTADSAAPPVLGAVPTRLPAAADVADVRGSVEYLASDALEGRGVGSPGLELAADFIANRFTSLHLRTLPGDDGYFQPFPYLRHLTINPRCALTVGGVVKKLGTDFSPLAFSGQSTFGGTVVFVGYGVAAANEHYDDYAGIDVRGKIVLAMRFEPHDPKGHSRFTHDDFSNAATFAAKAKSAADHRAMALLIVTPPQYHGDVDSLLPFTSGNAAEAPLPVIQITRTLADEILKTAGTPALVDLQQQIDSSGAPASRALGDVRVAANVQLDRTEVTVKNVIALLPGEGPHANEYVVVGAHYDHLGHGGMGSLAPWSHAIHHGADDNASGTAAVMDLADHLVRDGRLSRSVIFCSFGAEEEGMIGSSWFIGHPPVPLDHIVAMLNMDMVGRVRNQMLFVGGAGTAANLQQVLDDADAGSPLTLHTIGRGGFGPSDHMPFAMARVPVIFLFSGMHRDYHTPNDTADKVNFTGIAETVDLAERIVDELATMPRQPYVNKYDNEGLNFFATANIGSGPRTQLGVVPDYNSMQTTGGVRITGTTPGTPAEAAGLRDGDVIVQVGTTKIANLMDLSAFLSDAKPGDKVTITLLRDNQRIEAQTTLTERKG